MALDPGSLRIAGWLLLIGGAAALVGAFTPPYRQWSAPLEEALHVIHDHHAGWYAIHAGFAAGTVAVAIGLMVLARASTAGEGANVALAAAALFGMAALLWLVNICCRVGVTTWAADQLAASGTVPAAFAPWSAFLGMSFAGYSALGYLSVAALGWWLLVAGAGAPWMGWLLMAWGLSGGFVVGASVPLVMYIPFMLAGASFIRT